MDFCQIWLSCTDKAEADKITKVLLEKRLVACAKQFPVNSTFHWKSKIENSDEILLVMDSREDLFDEIEREVTKINSYETFVLQSMPVTKISKKAKMWLNSILK